MTQPKVLLIIESCNPTWSSVPLVGYRFFCAASEVAQVTLVTHARNRAALEEKHPDANIDFIEPKAIEKNYYRLVERLTTFKGRVVWPLYHALSYPIYYFFNRQVALRYRKAVQNGEYTLVHAITPMMPRYPYEISKYCDKTPFVLGPVNGGVPFPEGFKARGRREFSQFNFFRAIGRWLIPNYFATYCNAKKILSGSEYTLHWLRDALNLAEHKLSLFFENGVQDEFLVSSEKVRQFEPGQTLKLVFSGRLVPYKGVDMLIRAVAALAEKGRNIKVDIVGDGAEMQPLKSLVKTLQIENHVEFVGWVSQDQTAKYYNAADIFAFPSVREFGGAVVMEAMACGLPCIVVNNGGVGEYVDEQCGFKIEPKNETYVVDALIETIDRYYDNPELLEQQSQAAIAKAKQFTWSYKTQQLDRVYRDVCDLENDR